MAICAVSLIQQQTTCSFTGTNAGSPAWVSGVLFSSAHFPPFRAARNLSARIKRPTANTLLKKKPRLGILKAFRCSQLADGSSDHEFRGQDALAEGHLRVM